MELKNYLEQNQLGISEFAKRANMKQPYVWLIVNKKRKPSALVAQIIEQATGGAVTRMELLYPSTEQ